MRLALLPEPLGSAAAPSLRHETRSSSLQDPLRRTERNKFVAPTVTAITPVSPFKSLPLSGATVREPMAFTSWLPTDINKQRHRMASAYSNI